MKKLLVLFISIVVLFSCNKAETPDPQRDAFAALQGKYLICQSVVTTINGRSTVQVLGKGKGWDVTFGLYGNLDVYTSPVTTKSYQFQSPDKIYYWTSTSNTNQFYTIQSMSADKLVLVDTDSTTGRVLTEYFTVE